MFLARLMSFLIGHVTLLVQGEALEKFVNMAASRGIYLWDIRRQGSDKISVKVRISGVKPLRHIAKRTDSRFKVHGRSGFPFWLAKLKKRKTLALGAIVFIAALYILSSFVWSIQVQGNKQVSTEQIKQAAAAAGLTRGVSKWQLSPETVEKNIREKIPELAWAGVTIKGTKAVIEVAERKLVPQDQAQGPGNIVAKKAGLIKEVLVIRGQAAVKEGTTVSPGQVLISGEVKEEVRDPQEEPPKDGKKLPEPKYTYHYVRAEGMVRARVWYEGYGEAPVVEQGYRLSGRQMTSLRMKIGTKEIILTGSKDSPYQEFKTERSTKRLPQWRNIALPVELDTVKYLELVPYREDRGRAGARQLAQEQAMKIATAKIPADARVLEKKVEEIGTGRPEDIVRVRAVIEVLEEIGEPKSFKA